jgi:hypothetical protein
VSSKPRRLAVIAVATSLAAGAADAGAARAQTPRSISSSAQVTVVGIAAVEPPASVTGLARDIGVDTGFARRTLDELARSGRDAARSDGS